MQILLLLLVLAAVIGVISWLYAEIGDTATEDRRSATAKRNAKYEEKLRREEAERQAQRQRDEAAREAHRQRELAKALKEQQSLHEQMAVLGEGSLSLFESMPEHLRITERHLDQAEADFAEGAFAPFWDSVERAANTLGGFDERVRQIGNNASRYGELVKQFKSTPPRFPLAPEAVAKLSIGTATAERMKSIVRYAQRNFQFATIYEQRKTNQLLVAGFTGLAQALEQMTFRITSSIGYLSHSVEAMGAMLNESVLSVDSRIAEMEAATTEHRDQLSIEAAERSAREKTAIEMLDNIQRGRRPSL
ncbi:MAG: hypothetical protein JWM95_2339 [Gemmatimonadetes bacterium]|nr:hypothetical protein [Gemmatimonadota bacterium]